VNYDVSKAVRELEVATENLRRILLLPADIGARVRWPHNGVVWTRTGEDAWEPDNGGKPSAGDSYSTAHIASASCELLTTEAVS